MATMSMSVSLLDNLGNLDISQASIYLKNIENCVLSMISEISEGRFPTIVLGQGSHNIVNFGRPKERKRFVGIVYLMAKTYELIIFKRTSTKRDLYYENTRIFTNQGYLDRLITRLSKFVKVPRETFNIEASAKGLIAGNITFVGPDGELDVSQYPQGMLIPARIDLFTEFRSNAKFIVLLEKDAVFQKMLEEDSLEPEDGLGPAIIITGKGYPDMATRRLLNILWTNLHLPVFALVDSNPYGAEILATIKWGSLAQRDLSRYTGVDHTIYTVPELHWLGIHPEEIQDLNLYEQGIPLTPRDIRKLVTLKRRINELGNEEWVNHLTAMEEIGLKVEIESVTTQGRRFFARFLISRIKRDFPQIFESSS